MKTFVLPIVFLLGSLFSFSQTFNVVEFTQFLGRGVVTNRNLSDSWIEVKKDMVITHIMSRSGEFSEKKWRIVNWKELKNSTNTSLDIKEKLIVLDEDGYRVEFRYDFETQNNGFQVLCLSFSESNGGMELRYKLENSDEIVKEIDSKKQLISKWERTSKDSWGDIKYVLEVFFEKGAVYPLTSVMTKNNESSKYILEVTDLGIYRFYNPLNKKREMYGELRKVNDENRLYLKSSYFFLIQTYPEN